LPVSSVFGSGIDSLKSGLIQIAEKAAPRFDRGPFRMPVDRVFTMRGFGTVIAGTVLSGQVKEGDRVEIYPEGLTSRVRGVQVHHSKANQSRIGKRTAVNLPDISKDKLRRGQTAAAPGSLTPTQRLDAKLHLLNSYGKNLKNRERLRLHAGTDEVICRIVLLEKETLSPGETGFVQFVLEAPTVAMPQDRFVVRTFSPLVTIGGGIILDPTPQKHKRLSSQTVEALRMMDSGFEDSVEQIFLKGSFKPQTPTDVAKHMGEDEEKVEAAIQSKIHSGRLVAVQAAKSGSEIFLHISAYSRLKEKLLDIVKNYFSNNPYQMLAPSGALRSEFLNLSDEGVFKSLMTDLKTEKVIFEKEGKIGLPGHRVQMTSREEATAQKIEDIFKSAKFKTPIEEDVRAEVKLPAHEFKNVLRGLLNQERLVRLSKNVIYHKDTLAEAEKVVLDFIKKRGSITIAELRDVLQFSRKYAQAILEYFDDSGLTKRLEDKHILT
jgi:selenocysteine-specific elongation factor